MKPYATLISFGDGDVFQRYLNAMFASAEAWFFPGRAQLLQLKGTVGWPYSVRDRHTHVLASRRRIRGQFVFFLDADMLFEGPVAEDVVADGVTATLHPVQNTKPAADMTYERNPASPAYVPPGEGDRYYVGGILGAPRAVFLDLSRQIDRMCKTDGDECPVWQDESYLNRILLDHPPALELDERYCAWWNHDVPDARIRALNKTPDEFRWRNSQQPARQQEAPQGAFA